MSSRMGNVFSVRRKHDLPPGFPDGLLGSKALAPVVRCSFCHRRCLRWTSNSASDWRGYSLTGRKVLQRFCGRGSPKGTVRRDLNPVEAASFLIATVEGYGTLAKNAQDPKVWKAGIRNIVGWLKSLRAPRQYRRGGRRMSKE
jgi:hypothetical protein